MDRFISLSVGVEGADDYYSTFQDISELAGNLGSSHDYVSVSASTYNDEEESEPEPERLYYDDQTLEKVRAALTKTAKDYGQSLHGPQYITDLISEMQNAGILFRERPPTEGR